MIQSPRLLLQLFQRADAADVFRYGSNPNVSKFTTWRTHQTIADAEAFIDMVLKRPDNEFTWAIRLKELATVIGAIEFCVSDPAEAQIHYVLDEPYWNRGIMTEAAHAVLAWGIGERPDLRRVTTSAVSGNIGSRRVMEKCGMRLSQTRTEQWGKYPQPLELSGYMITREEWLAKNTRQS